MVERPIEGFDITTGSFLFNPERAFAVANRLNDGLPEEKWVGIEIYPVQNRKLPGINFLLPAVTADKVRDWQNKYPYTKVSRVHLEFAYDDQERVFMPFGGNFHRSKISPLWHKALYEVIRDAKSGYGLSLARSLGVDVNIHTNAVLGFALDNKLSELKAGIPNVIVENSIDYNSTVAQGPILYNPSVILRNIVEKYGFNKFLLGIDHLVEYKDRQDIDPLEVLQSEAVQKYTVAMHIAGPDHSLVRPGDEFYQRFFTEFSKVHFSNPVRIVFDFSPIGLLKYRSLEEQVRLFRGNMDWIKSICSSTQNSTIATGEN